MQQNYEALNAPPGREVGLHGIAEIGLHLRLWDRNQRGIAVARPGLEAAQDEVNRVDLALRNLSAMYIEDYRSARLTADRYRVEILCRLERAYGLMTAQYGAMTASFIPRPQSATHGLRMRSVRSMLSNTPGQPALL